jgi:uncharacterized repeat protein (TIGR03843 family)
VSDERSLTIDTILRILRHGEVAIEGRMPWSSNRTYLVTVTHEEGSVGGVYKPVAGERPLWDFPPGLHKREVAAYELAGVLGWPIIPPTVRRDGPHGEGSVQLFVDADFEQHHFTLVEKPRYHDQLRQMALFDVIANNTDRKSGHCLVDADDHVWGIDNGLCFATEFKLRTVIWDFAGEPIREDWCRAVMRVGEGAATPALTGLLDDDELDAVASRAERLARGGRFLSDDHGRRWPWPLV